MAVDYNDSRFEEVEAEKKGAQAELEKTYDDMISQSDGFYQAQIDASKAWAEEQQKLQNERTDFTIEQINQQKEQANKDYQKEQSASYKDWQKQSNAYGANAEAMAAQGMGNTGYSESAQVSMYNTYQNRVATARESYNQAILNYNNAMKDAQLQNNAALAEIAANALQQQLELALNGFQYKNQLLLDKANQKLTLDQMYYNRRQDVLSQINQENALAEQIRQYNENLAEEKRQFDASLEATKNANGGTIINPDTGKADDITAALNVDDEKFVAKVNALGYGPLSVSELVDLIESGDVILGSDGMPYLSPQGFAKKQGVGGAAGAALKGRASTYLGGA